MKQDGRTTRRPTDSPIRNAALPATRAVDPSELGVVANAIGFGLYEDDPAHPVHRDEHGIKRILVSDVESAAIRRAARRVLIQLDNYRARGLDIPQPAR